MLRNCCAPKPICESMKRPCYVKSVECNSPWIKEEKKVVDVLNVVIPPCMKEDADMMDMFDKLSTFILNNNVDALVAAAVTDSAAWTALYSLWSYLFSTYRMVITLPDGTVMMDTTSDNNSWESFKAKTVNENHNSRVAIFHSQGQEGGVGYETKWSTSDNRVEKYVAVRLNKYLNSNGSVRFSIPILASL